MATIVKRPSGKWQAQVRHDGKARSKSFGKRADAVQWARETERQAERGELQDIAALADLRETTLASILIRYRDEIVPQKQAGRNEACMLNSVLERDDKLARTTLDRLKAVHFAAWRDQRMTEMKPASICRYLGLMQHALDIAMQDWQLPLHSNPVRGVRRPTIRNRRERRVRDNERTVLMEAARAYANPLMAPLIALALETGMRRGEMLSARWCDLNERLATLHLPRTKNGHARTVPLSPAALTVFEDVRGILTDRGEGAATVFPMKQNAVLLAWRQICTRAGIEDLHFHDLRHEAISSFFERGLSMPEVAMISGHRDARMLMRYTHLHAVNIVEKLR
ncbi:integrase [Aliiruegeria lutimaris]|uniref:Phage integrase family protein n=1 Tax=Aliiruegeria lutimaris TaxID=571298 RepID=A0A1G8U0G2_9RHOB|nr:tyrosine-type recombinase/integrase [Aliiruegeria lutimaris]SDJ47207.1 Phage integrase family protein [Aliiruegeria lutimaris]